MTTRPVAALLSILGLRLPSVSWPAVAWALRLMLAHKRLVVGLALATIGSAVTEGLGIAVLVPLLDAINHNANAFASVPIGAELAALFKGWSAASEIELIAILLALLALLRAGLGYFMAVLSQLFTITIDQGLKTTIVRLVHGLDFERVQYTGATNLLSLTMSVSTQAAYFCAQAATAVGSVVMFGLYLAICLLLSWQLTLLAGAALLLGVQLVRLPLTRRMIEVGNTRTATLIDMNHTIYGGYSGAKLLRLVAGVDRHIAKVVQSIARHMKNERRHNHLQSLIDPMFQSVIAVILAAMLVIVAVVLGDDAINRIPLLLLFLFVLNRVISPVQTLNRLRLGLVASLPATQTTFEFIQQTQQRQETDGWRAYPGLHRQLSIERVVFSYGLNDGPAIEEVSFAVPACRMTALVGASGGGKTTLVGLLTRLYRPQSGRITVDGIDISELRLAEWRRRVAVVTQDVLALARALLARPDLLILDEATSNLDADTEHLVSKVLDRLVEECAILVIAHRLVTVQRADNIVVLDRGRVVETGTHESLMRARGRYCGMVNRQMFTAAVPLPVPEESAMVSGAAGG